jgi:hypothetical protein
MKKNFFWKSFVSFAMAWTIVILLISGSVLFIAPPGRVANWTIWTMLGFSKANWQSIHTIFSYTFVILSIFHLFTLNWKAFWSYITTKRIEGLSRPKEFGLSIALIALIFAGTYFNFQPFKGVMAFGEETKESWETKKDQPPVPHAELLTIRDLSGKYIKMSPDSILLLIRQKYLTADSTGQTIAKISELNNMTPAKLYSIIIPENVNSPLKSESKPVIQGTGRKTITEISSELGIDVDKVIEELKLHGINATPEEKLKAVAENAGKTPVEILEMIKKKS